MQAQDLVGTWQLVRFIAETAGGMRLAPWGANPSGQLMYSADGRMSLVMADPQRPQPATLRRAARQRASTAHPSDNGARPGGGADTPLAANPWRPRLDAFASRESLERNLERHSNSWRQLAAPSLQGHLRSLDGIMRPCVGDAAVAAFRHRSR
jgi:hypothetical protein